MQWVVMDTGGCRGLWGGTTAAYAVASAGAGWNMEEKRPATVSLGAKRLEKELISIWRRVYGLREPPTCELGSIHTKTHTHTHTHTGTAGACMHAPRSRVLGVQLSPRVGGSGADQGRQNAASDDHAVDQGAR